MHPGVGDHAAAQLLTRGDDLPTQPELLEQGVDRAGRRRVGLGADVQLQARDLVRGDRPADGGLLLEHHHLVPGPLPPSGRQQAREPAADDHGALPHARSAALGASGWECR